MILCQIKKDLEYHHINFQKDFQDGLMIDKPHIMKDAKYNGVVLCRKCHDKVDRNEIVIIYLRLRHRFSVHKKRVYVSNHIQLQLM